MPFIYHSLFPIFIRYFTSPDKALDIVNDFIRDFVIRALFDYAPQDYSFNFRPVVIDAEFHDFASCCHIHFNASRRAMVGEG